MKKFLHRAIEYNKEITYFYHRQITINFEHGVRVFTVRKSVFKQLGKARKP